MGLFNTPSDTFSLNTSYLLPSTGKGSAFPLVLLLYKLLPHYYRPAENLAELERKSEKICSCSYLFIHTGSKNLILRGLHSLNRRWQITDMLVAQLIILGNAEKLGYGVSPQNEHGIVEEATDPALTNVPFLKVSQQSQLVKSRKTPD